MMHAQNQTESIYIFTEIHLTTQFSNEQADRSMNSKRSTREISNTPHVSIHATTHAVNINLHVFINPGRKYIK